VLGSTPGQPIVASPYSLFPPRHCVVCASVPCVASCPYMLMSPCWVWPSWHCCTLTTMVIVRRKSNISYWGGKPRCSGPLLCCISGYGWMLLCEVPEQSTCCTCTWTLYNDMYMYIDMYITFQYMDLRNLLQKLSFNRQTSHTWSPKVSLSLPPPFSLYPCLMM
jgi:hypothetical protein